MKIDTTVSSPSSLCPVTSERPLTNSVRFPLWLKELIGGFSSGSPQDIYWREITLGIPREGQGRRLVEMAHQEDADCADKKHRRHDNKADPVDHPGNQEPLLILLGLRESRDYQWCWINPKKMSKCKDRVYILEVAVLPCSLSYMFAGDHALLHLWRGLCQTGTELLSCSPVQPIIYVQTFMQ